MGFRARLKQRQIDIDSMLCVGLDPLVAKIPTNIRQRCYSTADAVLLWMMQVVDQIYSAHYFNAKLARTVTITSFFRLCVS